MAPLVARFDLQLDPVAELGELEARVLHPRAERAPDPPSTTLAPAAQPLSRVPGQAPMRERGCLKGLLRVDTSQFPQPDSGERPAAFKWTVIADNW